MRPNVTPIVLPGLIFAILSVIAISLVGAGLIPGVSASPARQDPTPPPGDTIINNYYGIDCGTEDTPCMVTFPPGYNVPVVNGGEGCMVGTPPATHLGTCPTPLAVQSILSDTVGITTTVPISTTDIPRTWGDGDSFLLLCLLVIILSKFMILVIADIAEKNIFVWIYRTLVTMVFVSVDIAILYPATLRSIDVTIYGLWLGVWVFLMLLDRAIDFFRHLTGRR